MLLEAEAFVRRHVFDKDSYLKGNLSKSANSAILPSPEWPMLGVGHKLGHYTGDKTLFTVSDCNHLI